MLGTSDAAKEEVHYMCKTLSRTPAAQSCFVGKSPRLTFHPRICRKTGHGYHAIPRFSWCKYLQDVSYTSFPMRLSDLCLFDLYIYNYRFQIYDLLVISFPSPVCHIMRLLVFPYLAGLSPQQWLRKLLLTRQAWHMSYKSLNANWVWQGGKLLNALEFFPTIDWRKSSLFAFCSEPVRFCAAFVHQQISLNCCS